MVSAKALFAVESWTLYALAVGSVFVRLISRSCTLGSFWKLQLDDWIMAFAIVPFTGMVFIANGAHMSDNIHKRTLLELKMRFALEVVGVTTNWLVKACVVILYRRIFPASTHQHERGILTYVLLYCLVSFILIQVLLPLWCVPVQEYWDPLSHNAQCKTYHNHSILALIFDTTTILGLFIVPVAFIPTPRRLLLAMLITLGTSVLIMGIFCRSFILAHPTSSVYLYWYVAEITLMILFANLPFLCSLFTSTSRTSRRSISWPQGHTDSSPFDVSRPRKGSAATAASTLSPQSTERSWGTASTLPTVEFWDVYIEDTVSVRSVPPIPVCESNVVGRVKGIGV